MRYCVSILVLQSSLDGEERVCCFAMFVFPVSGDCCVALPHDVRVYVQFVIVVFPDHTHFLFIKSWSQRIAQTHRQKCFYCGIK